MELHNPKWPQTLPSNIIVRMPNWLGDLVMATPVLEDLRHHWKNARITAMCQSNAAPLLQNNPNVDEIFSFKKPSGWIHKKQHVQLIEEIRKGKYDLGLLLTNSFSSAWHFWKGGVENRIGYACQLRSFLLNKAVKYPSNLESQHLVKTYKMLLAPMGIPLSETLPALFITPQELVAVKELLSNNGIMPEKDIIIGINPGAAYGSAKCWLPERFVKLTQKLLENPKIAVIYFGDQAGSKLVQDICRQVQGRVINLAGKTSLRELMSLIKCCSVFLTNDSGPMHIAAALGVKLLALFGSTSDVKTGPYKTGQVIHKHVECSPCYKRTCPIDFRCMTRIETDEVYEEIKKMIAET